HHRLIESPRALPFPRNETRRKRPNVLLAKDALQNSPDVRIDGGHWLLIGKTSDGTRRVPSDTRQCLQGHGVVGECSVVPTGDVLREFVQIARSGVVAEP